MINIKPLNDYLEAAAGPGGTENLPFTLTSLGDELKLGNKHNPFSS